MAMPNESWRVERGTPDEVELAALTVVLHASAAPRITTRPKSQPRSTWANPAALLRHPLHPQLAVPANTH